MDQGGAGREREAKETERQQHQLVVVRWKKRATSTGSRQKLRVDSGVNLYPTDD